jgi:hypothetical protein
MAKGKRNVLKLSGKIGDKVHVQSSKYGYVVREAPVQGTRKDEPAFKKQHSRTAILNKLASELNRTIPQYCGSFKSKGFYSHMHELFRKEPLNNRFLLLQQVKGLEVNKRYPFAWPAYCTANVNRSKNKIIVELHVTGIPDKKNNKADGYYYEVILLHWTNSKKPPLHSSELTTWIAFTIEKPGFEFLFPVPKATVNWLLCLRRVMGMNEEEIGDFPSQGMQIIDAGTFDKKEEALLQQRLEEKRKKPAGKKVVKERVRVKPKWIG